MINNPDELQSKKLQSDIGKNTTSTSKVTGTSNKSLQESLAEIEDIEEPYISEDTGYTYAPMQSHASTRNTSASGDTILLKIGQIIMTILVIYLAGTLFYLHHFYPGTTINGINASNRSLTGFHNHLENRTENYLLTIKGKDGTEDLLSSEDLGLHIKWEKQPVQDLLYQQKGYDWPLRLFEKHKLKVSVKMVQCDNEKTIESLQTLSCMDSSGKTESVNASIVKNDATGMFELQDDVTGTVVDPDKLLSAVTKVAGSLKRNLKLEDMECYKTAEYTADSDIAQERLEEANNALQSQIIYDFGNDQYAVLNEDTFYDWVYVDDDLNVCVDEDSVIAYVDNLADEYNDYGEGKWFHTYNGNKVYLPLCTYGWRIDKTEEVSHIISEIKEGTRIERYPDYAQTANNHEYSCWGNSYIEVDITTQYMWCFKDGSCVLSTSVVTGCPENNTSTNTGIFSIIGKYVDDVPLVGEDYVSYVDYFMKFYNGEGFHDASWRDEFGGDIYLTNGSHGCVNMPPEKAEALYNLIDIGYPVIIYTDDMTEGPSE